MTEALLDRTILAGGRGFVTYQNLGGADAVTIAGWVGEALAHYRAIVDYCLAAGIAPVVTYNHFTSPHWFARPVI